MDSQILLDRCATHRDANAFAQIVERYIHLVYSAAMRRVGNRHLAEDVSQAVFVILATKTRQAARSANLGAWLLTTVRYASANAMKIERRRQRHERIAAAAITGVASANPADVLIWQDLAAELDDAILKLPVLDRSVVLERYFERRPIGEIAVKLSSSEGAIKQRLNRALERLRARLERRGVGLENLPPGAIAGMTMLIENHAVRAAPVALHAAACAAANGAGKAVAVTTIAKGAMTMMKWNATKIVTAAAAAMLFAGVGGVWTVSRASGQNKAVESSPPAKPSSDPIFAESPPVLVTTSPQAGDAAVDPKLTEIKITFSKDMADGSWSWAQKSEDSFPKTIGRPHYEKNHRTCVMPVKLEPNHAYLMLLNVPPFTNFVDEDGKKAAPYWLTFKTKSE